MADFEEHTQVFIVRIWREPRGSEGAPAIWRGVIEHVPTGERRYLTDLNEIPIFVVSHLLTSPEMEEHP